MLGFLREKLNAAAAEYGRFRDKETAEAVPAELAAPEPNDSLGVLSHGDED